MKYKVTLPDGGMDGGGNNLVFSSADSAESSLDTLNYINFKRHNVTVALMQNSLLL